MESATFREALVEFFFNSTLYRIMIRLIEGLAETKRLAVRFTVRRMKNSFVLGG